MAHVYKKENARMGVMSSEGEARCLPGPATKFCEGTTRHVCGGATRHFAPADTMRVLWYF